MVALENAIAALKRSDEAAFRDLLAEDPELSSARDENGVSLLMLACYHRQANVAEELARTRALDVFESAAMGRIEQLTALCKEQADVIHARSPDGFTPLHLAAFFGQADAARVLLDLGADLNAIAENPSRVRPIHSAVASRDHETVKLLVARGAMLDVQQHGGWTPLHAAALHGDQVLVELFLRNGADPGLVSDDGKDAAALAASKDHAEIAALLAGAASQH